VRRCGCSATGAAIGCARGIAAGGAVALSTPASGAARSPSFPPAPSSTAASTPRLTATALPSTSNRFGIPEASTAVPPGGADTRRVRTSPITESGGRLFPGRGDPAGVAPKGGAVLTDDERHRGQRAYPTATESPQLGHDLASMPSSILAPSAGANLF
jgi:hypothetical protein